MHCKREAFPSAISIPPDHNPASDGFSKDTTDVAALKSQKKEACLAS